MSDVIKAVGSGQLDAVAAARLGEAQKVSQGEAKRDEKVSSGSALAPQDQVTLSSSAKAAAAADAVPSKQAADSAVGDATSPFVHDSNATKQVKQEYSAAYKQADALHNQASGLAALGDGSHSTGNGSADVSTLSNGHKQVVIKDSSGNVTKVEIDPNDANFLRSDSQKKGFLGISTHKVLDRDGTQVTSGQQKNWFLGISWGKKTDQYDVGNPYAGSGQQPSYAGDITATRREFSGQLGVQGQPTSTTHVLSYGGSVTRTSGGDKFDAPNLTETDQESQFKHKLVEKYALTTEAGQYAGKVPFLIKDPNSTTAGGTNRDGYIILNGANEKSALSQYGRVWYDHKVKDLGFDETQQQGFRYHVGLLADNANASPEVRAVARYYTYGEKPDGTKLTGDQLKQVQSDNSGAFGDLMAASNGDILGLPSGGIRPYFDDILTGAHHQGQ